jgi:hypothetical protein
MPQSSPFWPNAKDVKTAAEAIWLGVGSAFFISIAAALIVLLRSGTGVLAELHSEYLWLAAVLFGALGYGVYRRSRAAGVLLPLCVVIVGILGHVSSAVVILLTIFCVGAARATFVLCPEKLPAP